MVEAAVRGGQPLLEERAHRRVVDPPVLGHLDGDLDHEGGEARDRHRRLRLRHQPVEAGDAEGVEQEHVGVHHEQHVGRPRHQRALDGGELAGRHLGLVPAAARAERPVLDVLEPRRRRQRVGAHVAAAVRAAQRAVGREVGPHDEDGVPRRDEVAHVAHCRDARAVDLGPPRVRHVRNPQLGLRWRRRRRGRRCVGAWQIFAGGDTHHYGGVEHGEKRPQVA